MVLSDFLRIADSHLIVGQGLFHMLSHMWLHTEFRLFAVGIGVLLVLLLVLIFMSWDEERWIRVVRIFDFLFRKRK